jgi:ferredoxin-thioredoxin reductase catalytic chain
MNVDQLYEFLKEKQSAQGYYFNKDKKLVFDLLEGLLTNKERYGYMSCPCRLSAGDPNWDKDIICPCVYREAVVNKYGSFYCSLYVSQKWNKGKIPQVYVPERRPLAKRFPP